MFNASSKKVYQAVLDKRYKSVVNIQTLVPVYDWFHSYDAYAFVENPIYLAGAKPNSDFKIHMMIYKDNKFVCDKFKVKSDSRGHLSLGDIRNGINKLITKKQAYIMSPRNLFIVDGETGWLDGAENAI